MAQPLSQADQTAVEDLEMEIQFQKVILKSIEDAPAGDQARARADTVTEIKRLEKSLRRLRGATSTTSNSQDPSASRYINSSPTSQPSRSHTAARAIQGMSNFRILKSYFHRASYLLPSHTLYVPSNLSFHFEATTLQFVLNFLDLELLVNLARVIWDYARFATSFRWHAYCYHYLDFDYPNISNTKL